MMPGPFIHISSMKNTAARLARAKPPFSPVAGPAGRINPKWPGADVQALGKLMVNAPNFASLGAIGPDLFFFLPDFRDYKGVSVSSVLVFVLNSLESLYADLDPYITKYEQYLGPISEDSAEEMSRLTGGLSEIVGNITGDLSGILTTFLETFVTSQVDFFGFFSLGLDKGYDEQAYFWSDMLHYRDSGQFCRAIWRRADAADDDQLRAYALGYQTHVATDVTGHAFVNTIAGGPYRMHWQRHHLVENHMDSFWYLDDPLGPKRGDQYPQLTESALYYDIAFDGENGNVPVDRPAYPTGNTLRENWARQRLLDQDSALPDSIANLLIGAISDVWYAGNPSSGAHPKILSGDGRPDVQLVKEAYDLFFRYLKYVTVDGFNHEPPDPPSVFPNLAFPTISEPGGGSGDSAPGDSSDDGNFWDDLLDFLLSLIRDLAYIVEVAIYLATLPWAILADLVTYPLRLGLYYALELPLFHLLKSFRQALVMTGFMLPMDDEIAMPLTHIGASSAAGFNDLLGQVGDIFGGLLPARGREAEASFRDTEYPRSIVRDGTPPSASEYKAPWQYPASAKELHNTNLGTEAMPANPVLDSGEGFATTSGPYAAMSTPDILFAGAHQDPAIRERFEAAVTPGDADVVGMDVNPTGHLGDSVAFSEYLIWLESRSADDVPLVEWNLDSDMGYGYHCWDWNRRADATKNDPNGHPYQLPCTLPEQSDDFPANTVFQPSTRLKIHWVGPGPDANGVSPLPDPGCGKGEGDGQGVNEPRPEKAAKRQGTHVGRNVKPAVKPLARGGSR